LHVCEVRWFIAPDFDFDGSDEPEERFLFRVFGQNLGAGPGHFSFVCEQEPFAFGVAPLIAKGTPLSSVEFSNFGILESLL
jgi:hypothetical protein